MMAVGLALTALPPAWTEPVRGWLQVSLRPGQRAAGELRARAGWLGTTLGDRAEVATQLSQSEDQCRRLRQELHDLRAELATARAAQDAGSDALLAARWLPARVLGLQARTFLSRRGCLDAGSSAGIEPDQLVVDLTPAIIDRGQDGRVRSGQLVCHQSRVWGKVSAVSGSTSSVQSVTDRGYRDLVILGEPGTAQRPEGILEGTGEPLARIRLIPVTDPIAVGDAVYSASASGIVADRLLTGRIARVERPAGSPHWEIWMTPALDRLPERVAVLLLEMNAARAAGQGARRP